MVLWGLISSAMMFTSGQTSFYVLRFLLGVAEAGFFPGIILYLTFWYTRAHRARVVALFMTAIALAGVFGGPLSGWIMDRMGGVGGLRNWEWLYLLEGHSVGDRRRDGALLSRRRPATGIVADRRAEGAARAPARGRGGRQGRPRGTRRTASPTPSARRRCGC